MHKLRESHTVDHWVQGKENIDFTSPVLAVKRDDFTTYAGLELTSLSLRIFCLHGLLQAVGRERMPLQERSNVAVKLSKILAFGKIYSESSVEEAAGADDVISAFESAPLTLIQASRGHISQFCKESLDFRHDSGVPEDVLLSILVQHFK